jgi:hypothetical protein
MEVQKPFSIRGAVSDASGSPHGNAAHYGRLTLVGYNGLTRCSRSCYSACFQQAMQHTMPRKRTLTLVSVIGALSTAALAGCVSSQVAVVGHARPAISADQVQIFLQPPESPYEQIANLSASSGGSFTLTAAGKIDKVIERLKRQAAKLGANGILLHGVGDESAGSVGAGISTETNSPHSPYGLGFGASAFFFQKSGEGVAIYVEPK